MAFLGGWCLLGPAKAQEDGDSGVTELEEIMVTTPRWEQPLTKVPAAISVVEQDEIQLGTQQLGLDESLGRVPGLFIQNRYNFAQDLRIAIRGFGARSNFGIRGIKVFVDDIPDTLPDGQGQVDSIDLGSAQRIEVIRGPASSLYGTAAGGVISIITEEGPPEPFAEARVSAGEYGFWRYGAKAGGQAGPLNYFGNLSRLELSGYRDHSRTENVLFNSKVRYTIDQSSDLTAVFNDVDSPTADDPGGLNAQEVKADRRQAAPNNELFDAGEKVDQQKLGFVYRKSFGTKHEIKARNYYVWRDFDNKLPFTNGGSVDLNRFFVGGGLSYAYSGALFTRPNRVLVGFDVDAQRDDRKRFDNNQGNRGALTFDQDEDVTSTGVFAQNEFSVLDNLSLTLGARYDRVDFDIDDKFLADGDNSGDIDFNQFSPMVGLLWSSSPALNLYGNISTAFETPTTTELANPSGAGGFNSDLDAQTATEYEVGVKGLMPGRLRYELSVFTIRVDDELIPFEVPAFPGRTFFRNAGKSRRDGVELGAAVEPVRGVTVSLAYTYSDFKFDKYVVDGVDLNGNNIPGIPEHLLFGELAYRHRSGLYGAWDAQYVGKFYADDENTVETDSFTVSNLRAGYVGRYGNWEIGPFLGINNLFNKRYNANVRLNAVFGRYFEPAPERNVYGGITVRYDFGS
jgi:iron complex outermembrane receptor protein